MNILHHKSYHVYSKKNIEKVKRDEAKAEEKLKVDQDRIQLAESEFRLKLLREKANAKLPSQEITKPIEHVNLFKDLVDNNKNEEHEAEVKEKDDKWNKQITMYLDKGTEKEDDPWYSKEENKNDKYIDKHTFKRKENKDNNKRRKRKPIELPEDPLDMIKSHLKKREKKEHRYHTKERKSKPTSSSSSSIEELRAKRLERERNEKARVKRLYLGPSHIEHEESEHLSERHRAYNSQFNRKETIEAKRNKR